MSQRWYTHWYVANHSGRCAICDLPPSDSIHAPGLNEALARVLLERAQDGYVNPTGGKTTGRERKDSADDA